MVYNADMLLYAIIATVLVSAISLVGILIFSRIQTGKAWARRFISLATGTLLAAVFFDLLPEAIESFENSQHAFEIVFGSIIIFFIIEKIVHHHHCVCSDERGAHKKEHLIVNNLIGDGMHNFVDGTIIAGAFLVDVRLGISATIAVALHEIPQEFSDFSILVYAGLSKSRALLYNFMFGLSAALGAVMVFILQDRVDNLIPVLIAAAAGNFLYLAMADLVPELHHEDNPRKIWLQLLWVGFGIALMYGIGAINGH